MRTRMVPVATVTDLDGAAIALLLGYLLEKISGQTYCDFLQQDIFAPLAMRDTGCDRNSVILPRRASGYTPGAHGLENASYIDMTVPFSAGELYSTTGDLLRWQQGLFGGKALSPASLTKMTTPVKENYGFGKDPNHFLPGQQQRWVSFAGVATAQK